jgi:pyruvate/2-oxoglutarate dehydrogenase complex dihydrolipoamide acyltransferase (E2) component
MTHFDQILPTVRIVSSHPASQGDFIEINERDYDAKIHTLYNVSSVHSPASRTVEVKAEAVETDSPFSSPAAEKLAFDFNIDPASIVGTGKNGKITKPDVEKAIESIEVE